LYEYNASIIVETDLLMGMEIETIKHNTNIPSTMFVFAKTLVLLDTNLLIFL
jgi:hypothetical protein